MGPAYPNGTEGHRHRESVRSEISIFIYRHTTYPCFAPIRSRYSFPDGVTPETLRAPGSNDGHVARSLRNELTMVSTPETSATLVKATSLE